MRALAVLLVFLLGPAAHAQKQIGEGVQLLSILVGASIDYQFEIDGTILTLSYTSPQRGISVVRVLNKRGQEVLALRGGPRGTDVRVNGRRVELRDGQSLYDVVGVDVEAVWLVEQNAGASRSVGTDWLQDVVADANGGTLPSTSQSPYSVPRLVGGILRGIFDGIAGGGGGSGGGDGCSSSSTTCAEEDINGNTTLVTHRCACGVAFCSTQQFTVEVPVVVGQTDGSTEIRNETRTFTRCLCGCLKLAEQRR
ncbi:MAG: hypothetical protein AAFQ43_08645 [Bacteroidota bacterium]